MTMDHIRSLSLLAALLAFLFVTQSAASEPGGPFAVEIDAFERFVESQMRADRIPGLSVGFVKDDFLWAKGSRPPSDRPIGSLPTLSP